MSNFIKIIFVILIIGIVVFLSVLLINSKDSGIENKTVISNDEDDEIQSDLRIAMADLDTLNPILSTNRNVYEFTKVIYEPLVSLDANYRKEYALAEKIEKRNETQYVVYLKDAKWHDGTKVKSEDFHFTIKMIQNNASIYKENIENIASIKTINDESFIITLKSPVKYFEYLLTFPVMKKIDEKNFQDKNKIPIGSGLFKLKEVKNNTISYEVFEEYRDKEVLENSKFKELYIYRYKTIGEVYNAFKSGNIDIINSLNDKYIDQIGTYGYIDVEYKYRDFHFLAFNTKKVDKNIRKAVSLVIDKEKLSKELGKGIVYSAFPTDFAHWTYPQPFKLDNNLEEAKKILQDNNYELKDGKWTDKKTKKTLKYSILVNSSNKVQSSIASKIAASLNKFGIETVITKQGKDTYYSVVQKRNYDMAIIGRRNDFTPSLDMYFANGNYFNYNNKELIALLEEAENINDEKEFLEIYNKVYNIYLEDLPFIGIGRNTRRLITSLGLHMETVPNSYNILQKIEKWYRK